MFRTSSVSLRAALDPGEAALSLLPIEHEFRHFPFEADRQQTQRQAEYKGQRGPELIVELEPERGGIKQSGHDRDAGVEFAAEQQRHVVAENVAQHAARRSR